MADAIVKFVVFCVVVAVLAWGLFVGVPGVIDSIKASSYDDGEIVSVYTGTVCWQCPRGEQMYTASRLTKTTICMSQYKIETIASGGTVTVTANPQGVTSMANSIRVKTQSGGVCLIVIDDVKAADN